MMSDGSFEKVERLCTSLQVALSEDIEKIAFAVENMQVCVNISSFQASNVICIAYPSHTSSVARERCLVYERHISKLFSLSTVYHSLIPSIVDKCIDYTARVAICWRTWSDYLSLSILHLHFDPCGGGAGRMCRPAWKCSARRCCHCSRPWAMTCGTSSAASPPTAKSGLRILRDWARASF